MKLLKRLRSISVFSLFLALVWLAWIWVQSPTYALLQVMIAIHNKDWAKFERFVELDQLITSAYLAVKNIDKEDMTASSSSMILNIDALLQAGLSLPQRYELKNSAKKEIKQYFQLDIPAQQAQKKFSSLGRILKDSISSYPLYRLPSYFDSNQSYALAGLKFYSDELGINFVADLKLERKKRWQLTEITNFAEIYQQIFIAKQSKIREYNSPILERLQNSIHISNQQLSTSKLVFGFKRKLIYSADFTNQTNQDIEFFRGKVTIKEAASDDTHNLEISGKTLHSGEKKQVIIEKKINLFSGQDRRLYRLAEKNSELLPKLEELKFVNGEHIKAARQYEEIFSH